MFGIGCVENWNVFGCYGMFCDRKTIFYKKNPFFFLLNWFLKKSDILCHLAFLYISSHN